MDKFTFRPTLKPSWLVQRLNPPLKFNPGQEAARKETLAFGGGLLNGGLNPEAHKMLSYIFSFDYMGAAEFEWGIVPSCLEFLATTASQPGNLVCGKISIASCPKTIYYLCHTAHSSQIEARIVSFIEPNHSSSKEQIKLNNALEAAPSFPCRTVGWLDCSNGFFFFIDKNMWEETCAMFGVAHEE